MIRIERVTDNLPSGIARLREEADAGEVRNMGLLVADWGSGAERFAKPGEALFAAFDGDVPIGIGGVTIEPDNTVAAMRMRRLYVLRDWRGRGVGRMLASAMMAKGFESAAHLTCNARPPGAAEFWDAMGFARVKAAGRTHELQRS